MSFLSRRHLLKGMGASLPLPLLASLSHGAQALPQRKAKRAVFISADYGIHRASLMPTQAGKISFTPYSKCLQEHQAEISLFSKLDHPDIGGGHACSDSFLNGMKRSLIGKEREKMLSLDYYMSEQLGQKQRYPLLCVGNGARITWNRIAVPIPKIDSPLKLWQRLFVSDTPQQVQKRKHAIQDENSILDGLLQDARRVHGQLDHHDQQKFDEYLTSIRETELKIKTEANWLDHPKPKVEVDPFKIFDEDHYPLHNFELYYEIMALALQTDSSRFITFQMGGGNGFLPIPGVERPYHNLTHHGHKPDYVKQLCLIDQWRYRHLSRFLTLLKNYKDEYDRPLLDSTMVLFGSGMGDASTHSNKNTSVLLAGGGFKHGQHHQVSDGSNGSKDTALSNLFVTMLQQVGLEQDHFSTSNGNLNHLLT